VSPTPLRTFDGRALTFDPRDADELLKLIDLPASSPQLHRADRLLRSPFGLPITFDDESVAEAQRVATTTALGVIESWRPAVFAELCLLCPEVQFIRDTSADDDKCVSFSDDVVPGALFITAHTSNGLLDPYNLADSLLHEYRHQKLYLLDRRVPLVEDDSVRLRSPWRHDARPPSGLLHACFVFVELLDFWLYALSFGSPGVRSQAATEVPLIAEKLAEGLAVLTGAPLTEHGHDLVSVLNTRMASSME
jgi:uncharacterized protein